MIKTFAKNLSVISLFIFSICPIIANAKNTILSCHARIDYFIPNEGVNSFSSDFDLKIEDGGDKFEISSSSSKLGLALFFSSFNKLEYKNIKNYSNDSRWSYSYDEMPSGSKYTRSTDFAINRYSGTISINQTFGLVWTKVDGKCDSQERKRF